MVRLNFNVNTFFSIQTVYIRKLKLLKWFAAYLHDLHYEFISSISSVHMYQHLHTEIPSQHYNIQPTNLYRLKNRILAVRTFYILHIFPSYKTQLFQTVNRNQHVSKGCLISLHCCHPYREVEKTTCWYWKLPNPRLVSSFHKCEWSWQGLV
jgi:hypothetical protein